MLIEKNKPTRSKSHLAFIRQLPCVVCAAIPSQAAHVRFGGDGGAGLKPSDSRVVPLCATHHAEQHAMPERDFWKSLDIDPARLSLDLWDNTGNHAQAEEIIRQARW